jgi:hypothetical protein
MSVRLTSGQETAMVRQPDFLTVSQCDIAPTPNNVGERVKNISYSDISYFLNF